MERDLLFRDYSFSEVIDMFSNMFTNKHLSATVSVMLMMIIINIGIIWCSTNIAKSRNVLNLNIDKILRHKSKNYFIAHIIAMPCFIYAYIVTSIMLYRGNTIQLVYLQDIYPIITLSIIPYFIIASKDSNWKKTVIEGLKHYFICFSNFVFFFMGFLGIVMIMFLIKW